MMSLQWDKGRVGLAPLGAMLSDLTFDLADGRQIAPLHAAPWLGQDLPNDVPPIMKGLQGEWPCVPFGIAPQGALAGEWDTIERTPDAWPHGFSSNNLWDVSEDGPQQLIARIAYPETDPVERLTRRVAGVDGKAAIELELGIEMRRAAPLPIGLHPIFRLPKAVGQARLRPSDYDQVICYPGDTEATPAISRDAPFRFEDLTELGFDPLALPYPGQSETILLLKGSKGQFSLDNLAEQYRVTLTWDAEVFPSLLLWISNGGRQAAPWNGRHWALGVEPICSAFDLGNSISAADNPLTRLGAKTAVDLSPDQPFTTRYSISVDAL